MPTSYHEPDLKQTVTPELTRNSRAAQDMKHNAEESVVLLLQDARKLHREL